MKRCSKCGIDKDEKTGFHMDSRTGKPRGWCKVCINADNIARAAANPEKNNARSKAWRDANPERFSARTKKWRDENPERLRQTIYRNKYHVDREALWKAQEGKCALCGDEMLPTGREKSSAVVDHDRTCCPGSGSCGKCVRGLIHWGCNLMLGYAKDDPRILRCAAEYVERSVQP